MRTIIVHDPENENTRCAIPVYNISCVTEYINEKGRAITKVWMKDGPSACCDVRESLDEVYKMMTVWRSGNASDC